MALILHDEKQQSSDKKVHMDRTCERYFLAQSVSCQIGRKVSLLAAFFIYLWDTFLLDHELSYWAEGGNLLSWSIKETAGVSLQTYP